MGCRREGQCGVGRQVVQGLRRSPILCAPTYLLRPLILP